MVEQYVALPTAHGSGNTGVYGEGDNGLRGVGTVVSTSVGVVGVAAVGSAGRPMATMALPGQRSRLTLLPAS